MDTIQAARELGKAIQQDTRYIRMMEAQSKNDSDTELQKMIEDFNHLRSQLNTEVQKDDKDADKIKVMDAELKEQYGLIFQNGNMVEYTEARGEIQELLGFINQIISGSASGQNPDTIEFQQSCGGDCGGCSGCS